MILTLLLAEPVCVCVYVKYPACCKNYTFSCGLDSAAHVHVLHACVFVYVCKCVFLCGSVCILLYSWQCETPRASSQVCMCTCIRICSFVCVCERNRQTGLSYGLHAVTEESRLWDMPGCQEHPPPTLYRLTAFDSSVWMRLQSAVSSASSCHLETWPSASSSAGYEIRQLLPIYFLSLVYQCWLLSEWESERMTWSYTENLLTQIKIGVFWAQLTPDE